jgi:hypothetical protein
VSQEVLKVPGYGVYRWNDGFEKIFTLDDMRRIKVDGHVGYNFFAMREGSRFPRLERAARSRA